ncbi:MAG: hypothetical protein O2856_00195 [Planctomycetota bacterium]|nr:hypothetical protein [Planctomycetota bacterium]
MIRTSITGICLTVIQRQNNFTLKTIQRLDFPRQWTSACCRRASSIDFRSPHFVRQEMHSTAPCQQTVASTLRWTPAESARRLMLSADLNPLLKDVLAGICCVADPGK